MRIPLEGVCLYPPPQPLNAAGYQKVVADFAAARGLC